MWTWSQCGINFCNMIKFPNYFKGKTLIGDSSLAELNLQCCG